MNIQTLENIIHELLDIEIYSAQEVLRADNCNESDKSMSMAYQMAINRAKKIVSICCKMKDKHDQ